MTTTASATSVFSGSAAIAYAAFNLRDPYYREMARFILNAARSRLGSGPKKIVELGCGIGISTMEALQSMSPDARLVAVEPEEGMRHFCHLNTMGDPRVQILKGSGENLAEVIHAQTYGRMDLVFASQVFHLFNPPGKESLIPQVLQQVAQVLQPGGVFAFDLGPSNFTFATPLADHRRNSPLLRGEVVTELAHPLYQRAHQLVHEIVQREFPNFSRENLWPPAAAQMTFEFLRNAFANSGFQNLDVAEELSPVSGERVLNFIRNGWAVFFRWPPLSDLPHEQKLALMNEALHRLFRSEDFEVLKRIPSYHPTAVFTAVRRTE